MFGKLKVLSLIILIFFVACSNEDKNIKRPANTNIITVDEVEIDLGDLGDLGFAVRVDGWFPENDKKIKEILNIQSEVLAIYADSEEDWLALQKRLNEHKVGSPFNINSTDSFYFVEGLKNESFQGVEAEQMMALLAYKMVESANLTGATLEFIEQEPLSQIILISNNKPNEANSVAIYASFIAGGKVMGIFNLRGSLDFEIREEVLINYKNWVKQVIKANKKGK